MSYKFRFCLILFVFFGAALFLARPVTAGTRPGETRPQVLYQTPTAQPDGRVIYRVQPGDSCLRIELLTGTKVEEIISLNRLDPNCTISPDQELILLVVVPEATATPDPDVTPTPLLPTPTPFKGNGEICILLYNDINGNSTREAAELPVSGGAASITERAGRVTESGVTPDSGEYLCIEIPEGEFSVSMGIPGGYNPTTEMNKSVKVMAGDQHILEFGAQVSSRVEVVEEPETESNLLLAILGGMFVVGGVGLGLYVVVGRRGR
jgi:hypothetical protein